MTRNQKDYLRVIEYHGVRVVGSRNGKHLVIKCIGPRGNSFCVPLPSSPGDHRALKNFHTQVKYHLSA